MVEPHPSTAEGGGRYARQALFAPLGADGQRRLKDASVLVVGCGALGTHSAEHLARAGIGRLRLVDRDVVEVTNLHRQSGFTEADAREGSPKAAALAGHLSRVNSEVRIEPLVASFDFTTALEHSAGIDLIVDGSDNVPTRFLQNDVSLRMSIPWVYGGAVGETGHAQFFFPRSGPCLRCVLRDVPPAGELATCDTAGVLGPAAAATASFQAAMALRYLAGGARELPGLIARQVRIGIWSLAATISTVERDPRCPACGAGKLEFLDGRLGESATVLCGRNAVQVRPAGSPAALSLKALAARLEPLGEVELRRYFLHFRVGDTALTIFPDGRAIVEGTTDPDRARALHARYIG
jgi:molybdopterin-synthase adenylyltransferase